MSAAKVPVFQLTGYADNTFHMIDANSVVEKHPETGVPSVNGEPVSQLSSEAQMILGIVSHPTNTNIDTSDYKEDGSVVHLSFAKDQTIKAPYRADNQVRIVLDNCVVGKCTLDFGPLADSAPGLANFNVSAEGDLDCSGNFAISPVAGPMVGDEVVSALSGNTAYFGIPMIAPAAGYGRYFKAGENIYLMLEFTKVSPTILVQAAGHLRGR